MQRFATALVLLVFAALATTGSGQQPCSNSGNLFYSHERNCDMYYKCENGTVREGVCPDGLVFDDRQSPDVLKCELPFNIDCSYRAALQPLSPPSTAPACTACTPTRRTAPVSGSAWRDTPSASTARKAWPTTSTAHTATGPTRWRPATVKHCSTSAVPYPRTRSCKTSEIPATPIRETAGNITSASWVQTAPGKPRLLACDPGLVFNPRTSSCDDPENVQGCQGYYNNLDARRLRELFGRR